MKSVGEVMAIGRTFKEALQKGIRSLEPSSPWKAPADTPVSLLREKIATPRPDRIHWLLLALSRGISSKELIDFDQDRSLVRGTDAGNHRHKQTTGRRHP